MAASSAVQCQPRDWQQWIAKADLDESLEEYRRASIAEIEAKVKEMNPRFYKYHYPVPHGTEVDRGRFTTWAENFHGLDIQQQDGVTIHPQQFAGMVKDLANRMIQSLSDAKVLPADRCNHQHLARYLLYGLCKEKISEDKLNLFAEHSMMQFPDHVFNLITAGVTTSENICVRRSICLWGKKMAAHCKRVADAQKKTRSAMTNKNGNASRVLNLTPLNLYCKYTERMSRDWKRSEIVREVTQFHSDLTGKPVEATLIEYGLLTTDPGSEMGMPHTDFCSPYYS